MRPPVPLLTVVLLASLPPNPICEVPERPTTATGLGVYVVGRTRTVHDRVVGGPEEQLMLPRAAASCGRRHGLS